MCGVCARYPCSCGILAAVIGTFCIFSASCATSIYIRLTPLYTTISCEHASTGVENLHIGIPLISPTTLDLIIQMNCSNPNPYSIGFEWTRLGGVYLGAGRTKVGDTSAVPGKVSYFPADGFGSIWVRANTTISAMMLARLAGDLIQSKGQLPLRLELRQRLSVDVMLLGSMGPKVSQPFVKECGMMISDLGLKPKIGPMACADSFDQLAIPPVGADPYDGTMRFSAKQVAPKTIQEGMNLKNWGLGITMAVFYTLGAILYIVAGWKFWSVARDRYQLGKSARDSHVEMGSSSDSNESAI